MAEYLLPTSNDISISQKQQLFALKTEWLPSLQIFIKPNTEYICLCGSKEDMEHILNCDILNEGRKHDLKYEQLYKGTISEQLEVFRIFENNLERR